MKARLLKHRIVTQIVRETTLAPEDFKKANGMPLRRLEDPATVAWKLGTGAYYKGGGRPWQLANVRSGVCYVGLVYKRTELTTDARHACCAAQMFLTNGEGVVFRGALGPWFHADTKQFHLDAAAAETLVQVVVEEYLRQHDNEAPRELFIHATPARLADSRSHRDSHISTNIECAIETGIEGPFRFQIGDIRDITSEVIPFDRAEECLKFTEADAREAGLTW